VFFFFFFFGNLSGKKGPLIFLNHERCMGVVRGYLFSSSSGLFLSMLHFFPPQRSSVLFFFFFFFGNVSGKNGPLTYLNHEVCVDVVRAYLYSVFSVLYISMYRFFMIKVNNITKIKNFGKAKFISSTEIENLSPVTITFF